MQLMSDDCIFENNGPVPNGTVYSGKDEVTYHWQGFTLESPHVHIDIEELCYVKGGPHVFDRKGYEYEVPGKLIIMGNELNGRVEITLSECQPAVQPSLSDEFSNSYTQ